MLGVGMTPPPPLGLPLRECTSKPFRCMITIETALSTVKTAGVRSAVQTADMSAHGWTCPPFLTWVRIHDKIISMYDHERVARCGDNERAGRPWRRPTPLLKGSCSPPSTWLTMYDDIIYRPIYDPDGRQITKTKKKNESTLFFPALLHFKTNGGCMRKNTKYVFVRIEDSGVCGDEFLSGRCAHNAANPFYESSTLLGFPTVRNCQ